MILTRSDESSVRSPQYGRDVVELRELDDEPDEERRELDEESPAWPETWSSRESSATRLTRSDESSTRSPQRGRRRG
jgi:hypothetical protein